MVAFTRSGSWVSSRTRSLIGSGVGWFIDTMLFDNGLERLIGVLMNGYELALRDEDSDAELRALAAYSATKIANFI